MAEPGALSILGNQVPVYPFPAKRDINVHRAGQGLVFTLRAPPKPRSLVFRKGSWRLLGQHQTGAGGAGRERPVCGHGGEEAGTLPGIKLLQWEPHSSCPQPHPVLTRHEQTRCLGSEPSEVSV